MILSMVCSLPMALSLRQLIIDSIITFDREAKAKELDEKWEDCFDNEIMLRKRRIALLSNIVDLGTSLGK